MTIRDISERVEREKSNPDKVPFTTLAHVTINQINFDDKSIVVERWQVVTFELRYRMSI